MQRLGWLQFISWGWDRAGQQQDTLQVTLTSRTWASDVLPGYAKRCDIPSILDLADPPIQLAPLACESK